MFALYICVANIFEIIAKIFNANFKEYFEYYVSFFTLLNISKPQLSDVQTGLSLAISVHPILELLNALGRSEKSFVRPSLVRQKHIANTNAHAVELILGTYRRGSKRVHASPKRHTYTLGCALSATAG